MSEHMMTGRSLHPMAEGFAESFKKGDLNRREYMASMMAVV